MQNKRPLSITIIGWFLVISSGMAIFSFISLLSPRAEEMIVAMSYSYALGLVMMVFGILMGIASGVALLKGKNWGRLLYLYSYPVSAVIGWANSTKGGSFLLPFAMLNVGMYGTMLFFLTRRNVTLFFSGKSEPLPTQSSEAVTGQENAVPSKTSGWTIFRKICGGILGACGVFWYVISIQIVLTIFKDKGAIALFILGFYCIMGLLVLVPAVFIWGRKQWQKLFGLSFVIVGGLLLMAALPMYQMAHSSEWQAMVTANQTVDPAAFAMFNSLSKLYGISGVVLLPLGIAMLYRQHKLGQKQEML